MMKNASREKFLLRMCVCLKIFTLLKLFHGWFSYIWGMQNETFPKVWRWVKWKLHTINEGNSYCRLLSRKTSWRVTGEQKQLCKLCSCSLCVFSFWYCSLWNSTKRVWTFEILLWNGIAKMLQTKWCISVKWGKGFLYMESDECFRALIVNT